MRELIEPLVKKIMLKGIAKYAKLWGVKTTEVQIRVSDDPNGFVKYEICKDFQIVQKVTFKDILDQKLDLFQYEATASPILKAAIGQYAHFSEDALENVSAFISEHGTTLGISYFNGFDNRKNILLGKFLHDLGY